ncbi:MAG: hypothetical protein KC414_12530, partial [Romboutsia sp.]|nr:hypothetical protein [Romboutsia sp.]
DELGNYSQKISIEYKNREKIKEVHSQFRSANGERADVVHVNYSKGKLKSKLFKNYDNNSKKVEESLHIYFNENLVSQEDNKVEYNNGLVCIKEYTSYIDLRINTFEANICTNSNGSKYEKKFIKYSLVSGFPLEEIITKYTHSYGDTFEKSITEYDVMTGEQTVEVIKDYRYIEGDYLETLTTYFKNDTMSEESFVENLYVKSKNKIYKNAILTVDENNTYFHVDGKLVLTLKNLE